MSLCFRFALGTSADDDHWMEKVHDVFTCLLLSLIYRCGATRNVMKSMDSEKLGCWSKTSFLEIISLPFQDQGLTHGSTPLVDNESQVQARRILLILIENAFPFEFDHRYEACRFTKLSFLSDELCISIKSAMAWRLEHVVEIEWVRLLFIYIITLPFSHV